MDGFLDTAWIFANMELCNVLYNMTTVDDIRKYLSQATIDYFNYVRSIRFRF